MTDTSTNHRGESPQPRFETRQIHAGVEPDPGSGARALPIQQTTSFVFPSTETAAKRFGLEELGPIYSRLTNPTVEAVENKIASLEGGVGALAVGSGQAATTLALLNIAQAGRHIVASPSLYGGTQNLFKHTLPKFGIDVSFVEDLDDPESWRAEIRENTVGFFAESVANPRGDVLDIESVAGIAHEYGAPLIVDNTLPTPYLLRPIEFGADVVVHSATKFLGGHGTAIAGVIVDSGNFDYGAYPERFPGFSQPDESYNGLVFGRDLGPGGLFGVNMSYILKARVQLLRDLGPALSPHNAFEINLGLETLSLRLERHVENAEKVAAYLEDHPAVRRVFYSGLPSSPCYDRGKKYLPKGVGAVLAFEVHGGAEAGQALVDALELHSLVANVGDVRSLAIHPASTTHRQLNDADQRAAGVKPGLVRLSVGLEHIDDILADLDQGLATTA
ncbi:O-acetylhomoserine aminocarboxypropyltransferase/cysteine synthase family protein [Nesterenkonia natronophila]|uniref:Aminotransferase class I/II-fold pyridoxal phosphate-dependent enzyme n=1 Tax=Nesterenkonia natronophila TaxID=2174932 RepID=A0A3A4F453_9MICC|nr:aminotransferase class I/II-fold pyridoxal phosphate-dependent enzyme [Nesterenkonia natronophila]RJN32843.1 aminotransferase class I/II-fold pyridoxal phosphate-dependent enzyme [Nesterenkonia natronophila]